LIRIHRKERDIDGERWHFALWQDFREVVRGSAHRHWDRVYSLDRYGRW
jgi:hypothetical protein